MQAIATTKMSSKGQVVIPEQIRKSLSLENGTQFIVLGGAAKVVVSGDRHLLSVSGYRQVCVLTPSEFVERY